MNKEIPDYVLQKIFTENVAFAHLELIATVSLKWNNIVKAIIPDHHLDTTLRGSLRYGNLDCLIWALNNGAILDKYALGTAIIGGNMECVKYLCEYGCPLSSMLRGYAAACDRLDILTYLHNRNCPYDKTGEDLRLAIRRGNADIVDFICRYCPKYVYDTSFCILAVTYDHQECLRVLMEHGYRYRLNDLAYLVGYSPVSESLRKFIMLELPECPKY